MLWVFLEEQHLCGLTVIVRSCFLRGHLVLFATSPLSLLNLSCLHLLFCLDVVPLGAQSSSVAICRHDSSYFTGLSPAPWCFLDPPPPACSTPLFPLDTTAQWGRVGCVPHMQTDPAVLSPTPALHRAFNINELTLCALCSWAHTPL